MKPFAYVRAGSVQEAADAHASRPGARYLAGGTNLVDLMKLGVEQPAALIDVSRLPLDTVEELADGSLRIGATVRNSDLAAHPLVRDRHPVLSQALLAGASGQLRNVATTGGNLLQRTRCPYFQDVTKPCNKRAPGTGCGARDGVHRDHAVLGHSEHCIATNPSDMAVALAALDARVELYGADGERSVPAAEFHRLPGDRPERDTELRPGELITGVVLPAASAGLPSLYRKARDRASYAFALASVAAVLQVRDGVVEHVGITFGGLAHRPWRARRAEEALLGAAPTRAAFEHAVDLELDAARPLRDNAYKVDLARNLAVDVLARLTPPGGA
ncbi:molybdopterin dehydrogenase [Streptomyces avermitilis]|uniref:Oxidoreductase molybdopterin binding subunit n=2 Tax=Streptomyces avermitilis TaxID=33903 RepID=Q825S4_STRAW|nr:MULTISPECIES: xanthine dehydrogenase family protein subunit M [Streptomyces]KUN53297.1 molybdopterin dehydrogenase [Streptomyces avermitilis]MYT02923.1 xanthine dehydrogenase family protein subunit M [Streptomyces sp. SID5469]OOV26076.1 molybdopterin dehydrogenase [Streptomyces avermitilis]BAC75094.1 putative oxidoreductase molybdopterin binding subunit [Streptomyces avermitilis MA-4680 = NBRC 14893]BBJ55739.1 FAD-binding molybdopterin dehydrogenase [Streptomyces avermitilis]